MLSMCSTMGLHPTLGMLLCEISYINVKLFHQTLLITDIYIYDTGPTLQMCAEEARLQSIKMPLIQEISLTL